MGSVRGRRWPKEFEERVPKRKTKKLSIFAKRGGESGFADFFSSTNTSIDLVDNLPADHLVEDDPGTRI